MSLHGWKVEMRYRQSALKEEINLNSSLSRSILFENLKQSKRAKKCLSSNLKGSKVLMKLLRCFDYEDEKYEVMMRCKEENKSSRRYSRYSSCVTLRGNKTK